MSPTPAQAEPFRKLLISTSQNIHVGQWTALGKEITPGCPVNWSVHMSTLHGGKQEGVNLVVIDNGKVRITVVPTRGMGVLSVTMGEVRLGWDSPVQEVVHPRFINLQARGGLGWLEGFNEWLCRCGMESAGGPGPDKFINNIGDEATMELTLHGKVANLPAQEVELLVEREPPYRLRLRGRVDERMLFGPKLELHTELVVEPGASSFRLGDVVTNRGAQKQEFEMIYHTNFGAPLLEEGAAFVAPLARVTPFNERAAKAIGNYTTYTGPTPGFIEQVYLLQPLADREDRTVIMLQNKSKDRAASLAYSIKELPYLTLWKNTAARADGYVTGLEPGTNYPYHRSIERKMGRLAQLPPGGSQRMDITFAIHVGKDEVDKTAKQIQTIQGNRQPAIEANPGK
jgi:hypothetical protein